MCLQLFITCLVVWTNMILLFYVVNRKSTYGFVWQNYDKIHCILKNDWKVCRWFLGIVGRERIEFQQKTCQIFFSSYCSPCFHIPAFFLLDTRVKQVFSPEVICFSLAFGIPSHFVMFALCYTQVHSQINMKWHHKPQVTNSKTQLMVIKRVTNLYPKSFMFEEC